MTMTSSLPLMQCPNLNCLNPDNPLGRQVCDRCQTPLVYRYLGAVGAVADQMAAGNLIGDRYSVVSSGIWLDTKPGLAPDAPPEVPDGALPYLHLYPHRLHVPEIYGFCQPEPDMEPILLLDNIPVDRAGQPFPVVGSLWEKVPPVRQVYWLWQIWQLWAPLQQQGVASSLLVADNLRVEGWRVRLRELMTHAPTVDGEAASGSTLADLAHGWLQWLKSDRSTIAPQLQAICQQMQTSNSTESALQTIATQLNHLLLEQAAQMPLQVHVVGKTTTGPRRSHNEDACYPLQLDTQDSPLLHVGIICDGIGGHAGGEVASQIALRSLELQIRALLAETLEQTEVVPPEVVAQQLEAIVRVANNIIAAQNDEQGRASRQRMGTTLVMAVQLPQTIPIPAGSGNSHELYLVHVGDSRAYWITPRYCHRLTVDDVVASREICMGRSLVYQSQQRPDSSALTQALGTREADTLQPTVQRFILEEEGILLLCSDGLSDADLIERAWEETTRPFFKGKLSLELLAQQWIDLANQHNGHDNTSVVLLHNRITQEEPQLFDPTQVPSASDGEVDSSLSEASKALLYDSGVGEPVPVSRQEGTSELRSPLLLTCGIVVLILCLGGAGLMLWRQLDPAGFSQTWERLLPTPQPQPSPSLPADATP